VEGHVVEGSQGKHDARVTWKVSARPWRGARKARTDQVRDEEEYVLPGVVGDLFGRVGGPDSCAVAIRAVPYCGHYDFGRVCELESGPAMIPESRSRSL
jgi:hypothetical protein